MTMTMAGGVGGPGTWNIYVYISVFYIHIVVMHIVNFLKRKIECKLEIIGEVL